MSQISEVLKNKNKVEKLKKTRRKNEIISMRDKTSFKAYLYDELKTVDIILEDENVDGVVIKVEDKMMHHFSDALYSEDLAVYVVEQIPNEPNMFLIKKRFIMF